MIIPEEIEVIPTLIILALPFSVIDAEPIVTIPLILAFPITSNADLDAVVPTPIALEI